MSELSTAVNHYGLRRAWFILTSRFLYGLFAVFSALWFVLKWSFAPIAFLLDMLLLLPIGKAMVSMPVKPEVERIAEEDLPDHVWKWLEESRLQLWRLGYESGQLLKVHNLTQNQCLYTHSMVHAQHPLGVGLNYVEALQDKSETRSNDEMFAEFTLVCTKGRKVDLTNQSQLDPIPKMDGRTRLIFSQLGVYELALLAGMVVDKSRCKTSSDAIQQLLHDLPGILRDEYDVGLKSNLQHDYVKYSQNQQRVVLTWKGALWSGLRTLWPTSVYYRHLMEQLTQNVCEKLDISLADLWEQDPNRSCFNFEPPIEDLASLQVNLRKLWGADDSTHLKAFRPQTISIFLDEAKNVQSVESVLAYRQEYAERDCVAISQCWLSFDNESRQCEMSCDSFYELLDKAEFEQRGQPALLPPLDRCMPLEQILPIAVAGKSSEHCPDVASATLEMHGRQPVWNLLLTMNESEQWRSLTIDATNGKILEEKAAD